MMTASPSATDTRLRNPDTISIDLMAVVLMGVLSVIVFARNIFVDNAVVFHDEYVYKVSGDRLIDQAEVIERQLAPQVPNRLFLALYGLGSYFGANYYAFAQLLNVLFWALGLLILFRVAARSGLSNVRSLAFLGAAALLPLSAYTKYFMPESMFFALFCGAVWALMVGTLRKIDAPVITAGVLVGMMYFVKPHALALVAANVAFLLLQPGRVRHLSLFLGGVIAAIGAGKWIAPMPASSGPSTLGLGVYGKMLDGLLVNALTLDVGKILAEVGFGHALFLLFWFGLTLFVVVAVLLPRLRLCASPFEVSAELRWLALYLCIASFAFVGMSVAFTALSGELGRLHSRYYFFLYPVALLVLFHFPQLHLTRGGKVVAVVLVVMGSVLMGVFGRGYSGVLPISLVGDCPEWGFVFLSTPVFFAALVALALAGVVAVLRPERLAWLIGLMGLASVLSLVDVTGKQKGLYRGRFVTGREAVMVEDHLGRAQMAGAIVVGENRDVVSKFLFGLTSAPHVEELPAGSIVESLAAKHPDATHVVALSDTYVIPETWRCTTAPPLVRICAISR